MRLVRLELENILSYRNPNVLENLASINVLIGPNNAGKSNIVQFLKWFKASLQGQPGQLSQFLHNGGRSGAGKIGLEMEYDDEERKTIIERLPFQNAFKEGIRSSNFGRRIKFAVTAEREGARSESVSVGNTREGWVPILVREPTDNGTRQGITDLDAVVRSISEISDLPMWAPKTWSQQGGPVQPLQWPQPPPHRSAGSYFIDSTRSYLERWHDIPPVRQPVARIDPSQQYIVEPSGANVARVLNAMQTEDPENYVALTREIMRIVPGLLRLTAPPRGNQVTVVVREPGNVETELSSLSTGMAQTIILVTALLTYPENSLVLIEEPEIHLHPSAQRALFRFMKTLVKSRRHQYIITTHSTVFAPMSNDVRVFHVAKAEGASTIHSVSDTPSMQEIRRTLGYENTDLYQYNGVVLIEGDTEEVAFPVLAEGFSIDLVERGIKLQSIHGSGKATRIQELLEFLAAADIPVFVILDGHGIARQSKDEWTKLGLIKPDRVIIWEKEFEDCFDNKIILTAFREWAKELGLEVEVSESTLENARKGSVSVAHVLSGIAHNAGHDLDKKALGQKVAQLAVKQSTNYPPVEALQRIAKEFSSATLT